jgi:hypothetical protein
MILLAPVFNDLQVASGQVVRPGGSDPTWTTYNLGIAGGPTFSVLGFDVNNYVDYWVQTGHGVVKNSSIDAHIHWMVPTSDSGKKIQFRLDVAGAPIDGTYAALAGSPFTKEYTLDGTENTKHKLLDLADLPAINTTVSTLYAVKFSRVAASANEYGQDVYLKYIDCHVPIDRLGSETETG